MLKVVVEMMTGQKIRLLSSAELAGSSHADAVQTNAGEPVAAPAAERAGFGIEYDRHEVVDESERSTFQAEGKVITGEGKFIEFNLALDMQRSYHEESNVSIRAGDGIRKDPLVINFDGGAAKLSNQRTQFDIDGDGTSELIPILNGDRGYLALDANANGKVDSGKELFGATTGDGFAELAKYDSDGNGWIDESDAVFKQLQVWTTSADGKGALMSLSEHGVGALYLNKVQTPFELKGTANQTLGEVRASGVYLRENGTAGSLQQIDLMV